MVLANLRSAAVSVPLPPALQGAGWTNALTKTAVGNPVAVPLAAYGYAVWQR